MICTISLQIFVQILYKVLYKYCKSKCTYFAQLLCKTCTLHVRKRMVFTCLLRACGCLSPYRSMFPLSLRALIECLLRACGWLSPYRSMFPLSLRALIEFLHLQETGNILHTQDAVVYKKSSTKNQVQAVIRSLVPQLSISQTSASSPGHMLLSNMSLYTLFSVSLITTTNKRKESRERARLEPDLEDPLHLR
jgi:hypothetical protein